MRHHPKDIFLFFSFIFGFFSLYDYFSIRSYKHLSVESSCTALFCQYPKLSVSCWFRPSLSPPSCHQQSSSTRYNYIVLEPGHLHLATRGHSRSLIKMLFHNHHYLYMCILIVVILKKGFGGEGRCTLLSTRIYDQRDSGYTAGIVMQHPGSREAN